MEKERVIDFHTHTFPDKVASAAIPKMEQEIVDNGLFGDGVRACLSGTAKDLSISTIKNEIELSVVLPVATSPTQTEKINIFAAQANEVFEETRVLSFGAMHPDNENYKEILTSLKANGIKGIKLHPDYQEVFFDDERYLRIIDCAANLDLIVVTHAGVDIGKPKGVYCDVNRICKVDDILHYPKLVLAHMGGWNLWNQVEEKIIGRDLYLDTSFCFVNEVPHLDREQFLRMIRAHGADKILFGTDSPWADQGEGIDILRSMGLDEKQKKMIFYKNALKLLQLS